MVSSPILQPPVRLTITLPLESNPIITRITKEISRLRTWENSSTSAGETIAIGLSGVSDLYKCTSEVLNSPLTRQALSISQGAECVLTHLLEDSLKNLEICNTSRAIVTQLKQASTTLRRRSAHSDYGLISAAYILLRKQIINTSKKILREEESFKTLGLLLDRPLHDHSCLSVVINVLRCISLINQSICESLLLFLSMPVAAAKKTRKKIKFLRGISFIMSRFTSMGKVRFEEDNSERRMMNELEEVDAAIAPAARWKEEDVRLVCKRFEALEVGLEGIENGLDSVVQQLTQTRASLLLIYS